MLSFRKVSNDNSCNTCTNKNTNEASNDQIQRVTFGTLDSKALLSKVQLNVPRNNSRYHFLFSN